MHLRLIQTSASLLNNGSKVVAIIKTIGTVMIAIVFTTVVVAMVLIVVAKVALLIVLVVNKIPGNLAEAVAKNVHLLLRQTGSNMSQAAIAMSPVCHSECSQCQVDFGQTGYLFEICCIYISVGIV